MWATKRIVKYSYMRQIVDVLGYMVIAFIVGYIWFNPHAESYEHMEGQESGVSGDAVPPPIKRILNFKRSK